MESRKRVAGLPETSVSGTASSKLVPRPHSDSQAATYETEEGEDSYYATPDESEGPGLFKPRRISKPKQENECQCGNNERDENKEEEIGEHFPSAGHDRFQIPCSAEKPSASVCDTVDAAPRSSPHVSEKQSDLDRSESEDSQIVSGRATVVGALRNDVPNDVRPNGSANAHESRVPFHHRLSPAWQGFGPQSQNGKLAPQSDHKGEGKHECSPGNDGNPVWHGPPEVIEVEEIEDRQNDEYFGHDEDSTERGRDGLQYLTRHELAEASISP